MASVWVFLGTRAVFIHFIKSVKSLGLKFSKVKTSNIKKMCHFLEEWYITALGEEWITKLLGLNKRAISPVENFFSMKQQSFSCIRALLLLEMAPEQRDVLVGRWISCTEQSCSEQTGAACCL